MPVSGPSNTTQGLTDSSVDSIWRSADLLINGHTANRLSVPPKRSTQVLPKARGILIAVVAELDTRPPLHPSVPTPGTAARSGDI